MRPVRDTPFQAHVHEWDAPASAQEQAAYSGTYASYVTGHVGTPRPYMPGYDSGVMCLVVGMLLLLAFSFKHWRRFFKTFGNDLLSVRRRANVFDDSTMSETRVLAVLVIQVCICEAILVYCTFGSGFASVQTIFPAIGILTLAAGIFYLLQLMAYSIIGSVFSDKAGCRQWIKGFNASQAFLSLLLLVPALVVLFYPNTAIWMPIVAGGLYATVRIIFVCKGFKIFFQGINSLLYFIIYLLAVEVTPLVALYHGTTYIVSGI